MSRFLKFILTCAFCQSLAAELPAPVQEAVLRVSVKAEKGSLVSTGFPVRSPSGELFIAASQHSMESFIQNPSAALQLADKNGEAFPGTAQSMLFSLMSDLALIQMSSEAENYKGYVFDLGEFDPSDSEGIITMRALGFPLGQFKQMEIWNVQEAGESALTGATYIPELFGASGSPLVNKEGSVVGVFVSGDGAYSVDFSKASALQALLDSAGRQAAAGTESGKANISYQDQADALIALAESGSMQAQRRLIRLYADDESLFYDLDKMRLWKRKAAENGHAPSMMALAGDLMDNKDHKEGVQLVRRAAAAGEAGAMFYLSDYYMRGIKGVLEKSEKESLLWLVKSAASAYPPAQERFAELHIAGVMTPQDIDKGLSMMRFLAEKGYAPAKETLSSLGDLGDDPSRDGEADQGQEGGVGGCGPHLFL